MRVRRILAAGLTVALFGAGTAAAPAQAPGTPEERSFRTADGVKLHGLFYKSPKGAAAPVVIMLHAYKANPDEAVWAETAKQLVKRGYHVFRFDFRGHGKSTDIVPDEFWSNPVNKAMVRVSPGSTAATDSSIKFEDFRDSYYPMLVQDLAAVRNQIDLMNDNGDLNASSIYLFGAGDAVNVGMFFLATEWLRERRKPNLAVPPPYVSPRRGLFPPSADPAGLDYIGAVWVGPAKAPRGSISSNDLRKWVLSPYAFKMRNETAMLFVYGEKDRAAESYSKTLFNEVLAVNARAASGVGNLMKPEWTFLRDVKGSGNTGMKLLGNQLSTEKTIEDFFATIDKERKGRTRKIREWDKPLYIDVLGFGAMR
ncbi:MAG TPA: alpha/beta fold hydrolase [Fimbriiglobus sp.]|nr:alpha/beta fold hydrolase [Fimbriiglobus sp.]